MADSRQVGRTAAKAGKAVAQQATGNKFGHEALQRRLKKKAPGIGTPGPRNGKKDLSPQDNKSAGSMTRMTTPKGGRGKSTSALAKLANARPVGKKNENSHRWF